MQQLILNIEEGRYALLLQFLKTLDYVKIVHAAPRQSGTLMHNDQPNDSAQSGSQLEKLQQVLAHQSKPLFQTITDPLAWQKQQR